MEVLILLIVLALVIASAYFISDRVYKALRRNNNGNATLLSVLVFIVAFAVLAAGAILLVLSSIRIER